jgi:hypothetical protein
MEQTKKYSFMKYFIPFESYEIVVCKQNTLSYLNLSMKFKTKVKCESNKIITLDKNILDYIMKY